MNPHLYYLLALDIARERSREAERRTLERRWLTGLPADTQPARASRVRRSLAQLLASVSRGSAWTARRLDSHVADDLGRTLAPAE